MFLGEYELRIDPKGRLAIPARFRDEFRGRLVISRGFDRCLNIHTLTEWQQVAEALVSLPATQLNPRRIARFTFSGAFDLGPDRQGRIVLPLALRQYAGINDEVVLVGVYTHLQVWARDLWAAEKQFVAEHAADIAEAVQIQR
jgi:MraZ protein